MLNFSIYEKSFKSFTPIKVRYSILNIFYIFLIVNPDFRDIYWREWYTVVNLTKDSIVVTLIKNLNIKSIIWNCLLVSKKEEINARHKVIYDMDMFINNLFTANCECKRSDFLTFWVNDTSLPTSWATTSQISCENWT